MIAPTRAELIAFVRQLRDKAEKAHHWRIEEAASWRDGTDADHESARELAEQMSGRPITSYRPGEREEIAKRSERIAAKDAEDVRLFTALLAELEGPQGTALKDAVESQAFFELMHAYRHVPAWRTEDIIIAFEAVKAFVLASAPASVAPKCVIGEYCRKHGFIHGGEAEELRSRVEAILDQIDHEGDDAADELDRALRIMLDEVDARDSCALVEAPASVATGVARSALEELKAHAEGSLRTTGQRVGVPLFVPSVAKRVLEIVTKGLAASESQRGRDCLAPPVPLPDAAPSPLETADTIARRIAASSSGAELERNIRESLLAFQTMTPTVMVLAEPHRSKKHYCGGSSSHTACGRLRNKLSRGATAYEWNYVTCADCLATRPASASPAPKEEA